MAKGKCINIPGRCSKALNKEVQEAELSNFVCAECGRPLVEIKDPPPPPPPQWKKILWIVLICLAIAACAYFAYRLISSDSTQQAGEPKDSGEQVVVVETEKPDSTSVESDSSVAIVDPGTETNRQEVTTDGEKLTSPKTVFGGKANYDKAAHTIKFTGAYTLDLGTLDDETISLNQGDVIRDAIVSDGYLTAGEIHKRNGESRFVSGIRVRL